jgi:tetratricopeptide (TPR) repeat protein
MDAGLAWTVIGSVAGVAATGIAVAQLWQSRRERGHALVGASEGVLARPECHAGTQSGQGVQADTGSMQANILGRRDSRSSALVVAGEIPQEPPGYQPRTELLAALEASGSGSRVMVVRAVTGMRGVGKTQLAAAAARARIAAGGRLVAWVNAETHGGTLAGLAEIADRLDLGAADDAEAAGMEVRHWLEADGSGCLVILDNATDPELIQPYLPVAGSARVIITSNHRGIAALGMPVGVGVFTEAEGLAYLAARTGRDDTAGARQIGEELGWLPLALAQAAAVIAARHLDYATYLDRLRAVPVAGLLESVPAGQYPRGAAATILLSLETATRGDASGMCRQAMNLAAVLSPDGIHRSLIHDSLASGLAGRMESADAADQALARLAEASLLTFSLDGSVVTAHRLVARVIREHLAVSGELEAACQTAGDLLYARAETLRDTWHQDRAATRDLAGQVTALHKSATGCPDGDKLTHAMLGLRLQAVKFLNLLGDSAPQAIEIAEDLAENCASILGPDHPDTLCTRGNLANAYQAAGRTAEAITLNEQNLADFQRVLGPDHPHTLGTRHNLADAYRDAGRTTEAITLNERSLADRERLLGPDHPDTLTTRNNLARAYQTAGRTAEAITLNEQTLADFQRILGPGHPYAMKTRGNLADAFRSAGRTAEAIALHEQNLADLQRILGPDHPDILTTRDNLALAYQDAGRTTEAITLYEQNLADRQRLLGPDHPDTLQSRRNLTAAREADAKAGEQDPD